MDFALTTFFCYILVMEAISFENYRCFGARQTAKLAPLTLLVGPNSTGKTSFLALLRAMLDVAIREEVPDFRESAFDMGSFEDVVHRDRDSNNPRDFFEAEVTFKPRNRSTTNLISFGARFQSRAAAPFPVNRAVQGQGRSFEVQSLSNGELKIRFVAPDGKIEQSLDVFRFLGDDNELVPFNTLLGRLIVGSTRDRDGDWPDPRTASALRAFRSNVVFRLQPRPRIRTREPYFAGGPVRSKPIRTYDLIRPARDPEGEYVPTYLATLYRKGGDDWESLRGKLEAFGQSSGLFGDIIVDPMRGNEGSPFQILVKEFGRFSPERERPYRNLTDVGYGVSQALPILIELFRVDAPQTYLLQQPEVHLHPSAQAALGSLFCDIAVDGHQLVVETHSDYLLDRVRMDVRDGTTALKPEDVSILYFEPVERDVKIHSITIDRLGNIQGAPQSYGDFFMRETSRSIGLQIQ